MKMYIITTANLQRKLFRHNGVQHTILIIIIVIDGAKTECSKVLANFYQFYLISLRRLELQVCTYLMYDSPSRQINI
jgi:hypothetical protein